MNEPPGPRYRGHPSHHLPQMRVRWQGAGVGAVGGGQYARSPPSRRPTESRAGCAGSRDRPLLMRHRGPDARFQADRSPRLRDDTVELGSADLARGSDPLYGPKTTPLKFSSLLCLQGSRIPIFGSFRRLLAVQATAVEFCQSDSERSCFPRRRTPAHQRTAPYR